MSFGHSAEPQEVAMATVNAPVSAVEAQRVCVSAVNNPAVSRAGDPAVPQAGEKLVTSALTAGLQGAAPKSCKVMPVKKIVSGWASTLIPRGAIGLSTWSAEGCGRGCSA